MSYSIFASTHSPMLVIYLLDVSGSMLSAANTSSRIEVLDKALEKTIYRMYARSRRGNVITPRYRISMLAYNDRVFDVLNGILDIKELVETGIPEFVPSGTTDTASAFEYAENLLKNELPKMDACPPPLVCHITDGEYTGKDPEPIAHRIMSMGVPDGNVLVQNVFISDDLVKTDISDVHYWKGILSSSELKAGYAKKLYTMSSTLPESYRTTVNEMGYNLEANARMIIPAIDSELINLGFAMSASTPIASLK